MIESRDMEGDNLGVADGGFDSLILLLHEIGAIKFGEFKLKSGATSPIYFDLRLVISYPDILKSISTLIWKKGQELNLTFDVVCGIPYTALPVATIVSSISGVPMILKRKEAKSHGTKQMVEGNYKANQTCLLIEDVVTTGSSVIETAAVLRYHDLVITDVISILDRGQGAAENLAHHGITLHPILTVSRVLDVLSREKILTPLQHAEVCSFLSQNLTCRDLAFGSKMETLKHSIPSTNGRKLMEIMLKKKSNLCISFDLEKWWDVLEAVERLGPFICLVKTHLDTYNFESYEQVLEFRRKIMELSEQHSFLILEDRKFGDIGSTVEKQLRSKPFEIGKWVHMVTAHGLPGTGLLQAFAGFPNLSTILIAEMSSEGNLASRIRGYAQGVVELSTGFESSVTGFVSQSDVTTGQFGEGGPCPWFLQFTPGVSLAARGDSLGQQYVTVEEAVEKRHADVIIVGRGILGKEKEEQAAAAEEYRQRGWDAWTSRILQHQTS